MLSKDTQEYFSLTFSHNEVSSNPFLEPFQRGWRSLLLPRRTAFIVVNKTANSKTFCCLTKSYYFFVSKMCFCFGFFCLFVCFPPYTVSIFSFFHMASIFKILQSTFREKFLPSSQPLREATVCIFDDKKIEQGNEFMFFLIFLLDECRQQPTTLLCSPSHACPNRYHIFAAGHQLVNFNPIRDISLHWFGGLFLIALHIQSPIKMLANKRIYSMHGLYWYRMERFTFFLHIERLYNVFWYMHVHTHTFKSGDKAKEISFIHK